MEENIKNKKIKLNSNIENLHEIILPKLKSKVSNIEIKSNNLHIIIKYVIELVEQTILKGFEKKEIALLLINSLIIDINDENKKNKDILLELYNDNTIENIINLVINSSKGGLNINSFFQIPTRCLNINL